MIADLKEKEHHKFRNLNEVRRKFARASGKKLFNQRQVRDAAVRAGVTNQSSIRAIQSILVHHPDAIFNSVFWKTVGRGAASAFLYGKFDPSYTPGAVGGPLSREASSLERIGGKIGTGVYKAGRTLQKAEKWFNVEDPEALRARGRKYNQYTSGSAFGPERAGAVDSCIKQRVSIRGGPDSYVGHEMGTPGYEKCINDPHERDNLDAMKQQRLGKYLPAVLKELGIDPERYMQRRRDEFGYRQEKYARKRFKRLRR